MERKNRTRMKKKDSSKINTKKPISQSEIDKKIVDLAYANYLARGISDGNDIGDWLKAERQIKKIYQSQ